VPPPLTTPVGVTTQPTNGCNFVFRYKRDTNIDGQQRTIKINTVLKTGHLEGNSISLTVGDKLYTLQSVIFHQGIVFNIYSFF
jgi:hypothetical protein